MHDVTDESQQDADSAKDETGGAQESTFTVRAVGWVESPLKRIDQAPKQGDEGAPEAWLRFRPEVREALADIHEGDELVLLTWLHLAPRDVLTVHPRGDETRPLTGVFSTRAPARPNPIGLHPVTVREVAGDRLRVSPLEALDGTPIIDVKPVLTSGSRR